MKKVNGEQRQACVPRRAEYPDPMHVACSKCDDEIFRSKKMCMCILKMVLILLGLLSLVQVQLGKGLAGVGKLDAVDDLFACADRASDKSQDPESVPDEGRREFEMEQVQHNKEQLVSEAEAKENQVAGIVGFEDGVAGL